MYKRQGLAGLAVADDQLTLAAADGEHGVDGQDAGVQRGVHALALQDAGGLLLDGVCLLYTSGKLNVAMGSVLNIWHNYREAAESHQNEADNTLPTQEELEAAAQHLSLIHIWRRPGRNPAHR